MIKHSEISDKDLRAEIRRKRVLLAGNTQLAIYGKLNCASGKRMRRAKRVFFTSEEEAIQLGFRPCGNCMRYEFKKWKHDLI